MNPESPFAPRVRSTLSRLLCEASLAERRSVLVARQGTSGSAIGDVLLSVRTVRNNVFHGGTFPDGVIIDPLHDEQLIRDCLAVLTRLLELPLPKDAANIFKEDI